MAGEVPTWAIRLTETSVNKTIRDHLNLVMETVPATERLTMVSEDHREAAADFVEKRQPAFTCR